MKYLFYVLMLAIAFTTTSFTDNENKKEQLKRRGIETPDYQETLDYLNGIVEKADDYYYSGDVDSAIIEMGRFIYYTPDFYGGYYRRGFYKDNAGMVEEAIADYKKALRYLEEALRMGYSEFAHLDKDDDMDKLRNKKKYKKLIEKYYDRNE